MGHASQKSQSDGCLEASFGRDETIGPLAPAGVEQKNRILSATHWFDCFLSFPAMMTCFIRGQLLDLPNIAAAVPGSRWRSGQLAETPESVKKPQI